MNAPAPNLPSSIAPPRGRFKVDAAARGGHPRRVDGTDAIFASPRRWWSLGALSISLFMIYLDLTVVNVALPAIQRDLSVPLSQLEWTVNAYALAFAVLLLSGGKLAYFFGRRRIFLVGL